MITATRAQQRRLLDLQGLDTRIRQLRHRQAHLPEQQALAERLELRDKVVAELNRARERLERLERDQRRHERELDNTEARYGADTQRKYSGAITSQKELDALNAELASMEQRRSDLEDSLLEIMEQREETEELIAVLDEREAGLAAEIEAAVLVRDKAAGGLQSQLAASVAEREKVAEDLPQAVLTYYDQVRSRKDGVAVAALEGRTCAGCRLELTASELVDVREQVERGLARCEQCGRILVVS